ncbi:MAG: hypothetical protein AAGA56_29785, partial [Myxococcota bacterium]
PVTTGRMLFDKYFREVWAFRNEVEGLDSDMQPMKRPLVRELNLDDSAPLGQLMDATRKRLDKVRTFGVMTSLRVTPEPQVVYFEGEKGKRQDEDKPFFSAIEKSAEAALGEFQEYHALLDRLAQLQQKRGELAERLDREPPALRKLLRKEIGGAGAVLDETEKKLLRNARTVAHFVLLLAQATDTGANENLKRRCEELTEKGACKKPPATRTRRRWRPPRGRPVPRPRPPPSGGGFEM